MFNSEGELLKETLALWQIRGQVQREGYCTNNSAWLQVWGCPLTFQTFCCGWGFFKGSHFKVKISLCLRFVSIAQFLLSHVPRPLCSLHFPLVLLHRGTDMFFFFFFSKGSLSVRSPLMPHDKTAYFTYRAVPSIKRQHFWSWFLSLGWENVQ